MVNSALWIAKLFFTRSCLPLVSSSDMVVQRPNPKLRKGPEKEKSCDFWTWASIWSSLMISMVVWTRYLGQSRKKYREDGFRELCYIITRKGGILQSEGQWKPFVSQWESKISRLCFHYLTFFHVFSNEIVFRTLYLPLGRHVLLMEWEFPVV